MTDVFGLERWVSGLPDGAKAAFRVQVLDFAESVRAEERSLPPHTQRGRCEVCGQRWRPTYYSDDDIHPECRGLA